LFGFGSNEFGQLGLGLDILDYSISKLHQLNFFNNRNILDFICGVWSSYVLIDDGNVYSFGFNKFGNLGIRSIVNKDSPKKIDFENDEKIIKIFSGCCCQGAFFYSS
jgi:alpha-tubulin suppressor-like RCC1 family protein